MANQKSPRRASDWLILAGIPGLFAIILAVVLVLWLRAANQMPVQPRVGSPSMRRKSGWQPLERRRSAKALRPSM